MNSDNFWGYNAPSLSGLSLPGTIPAELPSYSSDYNYGTSAQPDISGIARGSDGGFFSGLLNGVKSTTDSLIGAWSQINSIETNFQNQRFAQAVQGAQLDLQKTTVLGNIDVAKAKAVADSAIEKTRASAAVEIASRQADNAKYGNLPVSVTGAFDKYGVYIAAAGLVLAFLQYNKGKK